MSRAYSIRVSETVTKTIHVEDGLAFHLELLGILSKERMARILSEKLKEQGFEPQADETLTKEIEGIHIQVSLETGQVTVGLAIDESIQKSDERTVIANNESQAHARVRKALELEIADDRAARQRKITEHLERHIGDIRTELDRVSTNVVAEALKQRAAELGEIQEIVENDETGELTIKVRV